MSEHRNYQSRIFWGLILIIVGVLFLADRMGGFDFGTMIGTYWPVVFIVLGLSILIGSGFRRAGGGVFFIVFGAFFLLSQLDILDYDVWQYIWPAGIILVGLWLLLRPVFRHRGAEKFPDIKENDIDLTCIFSGMKRRIESQNFKGGHATAIMGGLELDFTSAGLEGGKATVDATAIMGGVDIKVPGNWRVVVDGTPILGGIEDKHRNVPEAEVKATLFVKATAIFGGVTIKS
jgi:predicted membrane protein